MEKTGSKHVKQVKVLKQIFLILEFLFHTCAQITMIFVLISNLKKYFVDKISFPKCSYLPLTL